MPVKAAEQLAKELDNLNADLDYAEAAISSEAPEAGSSAQSSNQALVTEDSPELQANLKAVKKKSKKKRIKAEVEVATSARNAGHADPSSFLQAIAEQRKAAATTGSSEDTRAAALEIPAGTGPEQSTARTPYNLPTETPIQQKPQPEHEQLTEGTSLDLSTETSIQQKLKAGPEQPIEGTSHDLPTETLIQQEPEPGDEQPKGTSHNLPAESSIQQGLEPGAELSIEETSHDLPTEISAQQGPEPEPGQSIERTSPNTPSETSIQQEVKAEPEQSIERISQNLPTETSIDKEPEPGPHEGDASTQSSISPKPLGESAMDTAIQPAPTQNTLNRRARADSVNFIRSRTNSRSGASTPLIAPVRNIAQSLAEAAGYLPRPVEIEENPLETETVTNKPALAEGPPTEQEGENVPRDEPAGYTTEQKGKGVVRNQPAEIATEQKGKGVVRDQPGELTAEQKGKGGVRDQPVKYTTEQKGKGAVRDQPVKHTTEQKGKGVVRDQPVGYTTEQKGKGTHREPPVQKLNISTAEVLDGNISSIEEYAVLFGPPLKKNEEKAPATAAVITKKPSAKDSHSAAKAQPRDDRSTAVQPEPSPSETGPSQNKKKKKKSGKKKKMSHPERVKKYIQAAKTSARLARNEIIRSMPIDYLRHGSDPMISSSSASQGVAGNTFANPGNPPADRMPPLIPDNNAGVNGLRWAYATHSEADRQLLNYNLWLFEKIPPIQAAPLRFPEPYHNLAERPPMIVNSDDFVVGHAPAVHFNGDPDLPGDTLMHIFPSPDRRPDGRAHPGHPDFLPTRLLLDYQAVEIAGGTVWRHDRELLDCRHRKCKKKCSDYNRDTILCLGCGPKTYTRYCSIGHMIDDLAGHWRECGTDTMLIKDVVDHNTTPPHFARFCPAIPNIHGWESQDRYRQRAYAMMTAGQYTLFNDLTTKVPIVLTWPTSDPNHIEMSSRVERLLNILLFDHKPRVLVGYFWRLIRELLIKRNMYTREACTALGVQFAMEFDDNFTATINAWRENYIRPLCEADWDGKNEHHHAGGSACVKWFHGRLPFGDMFHSSGSGIKGVVESYEARYWVLRAWRQRHECPFWRQRAENTGAVKVCPMHFSLCTTVYPIVD